MYCIHLKPISIKSNLYPIDLYIVNLAYAYIFPLVTAKLNCTLGAVFQKFEVLYKFYLIYLMVNNMNWLYFKTSERDNCVALMTYINKYTFNVIYKDWNISRQKHTVAKKNFALNQFYAEENRNEVLVFWKFRVNLENYVRLWTHQIQFFLCQSSSASIGSGRIRTMGTLLNSQCKVYVYALTCMLMCAAWWTSIPRDNCVFSFYKCVNLHVT